MGEPPLASGQAWLRAQSAGSLLAMAGPSAGASPRGGHGDAGGGDPEGVFGSRAGRRRFARPCPGCRCPPLLSRGGP
eukprot:5424705-Alexandrium_andersonii.AAC.1